MSNKKPTITKGKLDAREYFIIAAVAFVIYAVTKSVIVAVVFDISILAAVIIAVWNYYGSRKTDKL